MNNFFDLPKQGRAGQRLPGLAEGGEDPAGDEAGVPGAGGLRGGRRRGGHAAEEEGGSTGSRPKHRDEDGNYY